jgi:hypothetical protein
MKQNLMLLGTVGMVAVLAVVALVLHAAQIKGMHSPAPMILDESPSQNIAGAAFTADVNGATHKLISVNEIAAELQTADGEYMLVQFDSESGMFAHEGMGYAVEVFGNGLRVDIDADGRYDRVVRPGMSFKVR